jgi:hypothetical protein
VSSSRIGLHPLLRDLSFGSVYFVESSTSNINEGHMRYICRRRRLKMMPENDEYSRERLTIEVDRSIVAEDVVSTLASLFRLRGAPAFIRLDRAGQSSSLEPSGGGWSPPGLEPSTSSRDLRGRTPTRSRSSVAFQTRCERGRCSPINWKRRCWWRITAITRTTTGHIER